MDDARFDSLTRMLAAGHSRRQGLRVLAGAGAALLALARPASRGASAHHAILVLVIRAVIAASAWPPTPRSSAPTMGSR